MFKGFEIRLCFTDCKSALLFLFYGFENLSMYHGFVIRVMFKGFEIRLCFTDCKSELLFWYYGFEIRLCFTDCKSVLLFWYYGFEIRFNWLKWQKIRITVGVFPFRPIFNGIYLYRIIQRVFNNSRQLVYISYNMVVTLFCPKIFSCSV